MDIGMPLEPPDERGLPDADDAAYVERVIAGIQAWQARAPSVVGHITGMAFKPVTWILQTVVPSSVIEGILTGADWAASRTLMAAKYPGTQLLRECDIGAAQVRVFHVALAAGEGGAAGFVGLPAVLVDIPAVVALALRVIRQTGVEYGFSDTDDLERQFVLQVLAAASANTMREKAGATITLQKLANIISKTTWKAMGKKAATSKIGLEFGIMSEKNLAKQVGVNLTKRKALEILPVVGAVVGVATNGKFIRDVGIAAQMAYQERWLRDRGLILDAD